MSTSPIALSRQNSITNDFSPENVLQETTTNSSRSITPDLAESSSAALAGRVSEITNTQEPQPDIFIVRVVKKAFRSLSSLFSVGKKDQAPIEKLNVEEVDLHIPCPEEKSETGESSPGYAQVSSSSVEIQEEVAESPALHISEKKEEFSEDVAEKSSAIVKEEPLEASLGTEESSPGYAQVAFSSLERQEDVAESRALEVEEKSSVIVKEEPLEPSSEGPQATTAEGDQAAIFSPNQQIIVQNLAQEIKNYFTANASNPKVSFVLKKAEEHYLALVNSNLRRHKHLDSSDKQALALNRSRAFLEIKYNFFNKK